MFKANCTFIYCDGFGVSYATTFQIHGTSHMSVATQRLRIPKEPNCWKPQQREMKPWGEDVFFPERKHPICEAADKRTDTEKRDQKKRSETQI
jgi:hypothetical protein